MTVTTPEKPLTERQQEIFGWICEQAEKGPMPTLAEISAKFNIAGKSGVVCHLNALANKGFIHAHPKGAKRYRSIRIKSQNGFQVTRREDKIGVRIDRLLTPAEASMLADELSKTAVKIAAEGLK